MDTSNDIYTVNDNLVQFLTNEQRIDYISVIFGTKNAAAQVTFIESILLQYNRMPNLLLCEKKSNSKSLQLRKKGNKFFEAKKYYQALVEYNKSVCFAESSEMTAIVYGNRSAVYYEMKLYSECLANIKLAFDTGIPDHIRPKLETRQANCLAERQLKKDANEFDVEPIPDIKLSHPPHPKVPFISNCLEMKVSPDKGRHIITNKDLKPGQIIAYENSFFNVLGYKLRYERCSYCMQENGLSLIPCTTCTNALFCNKECLEMADKTFHRFECPIIDYLLALFNKIHLSAIRVVIRAFQCFDSIDDLRQFVREFNENNANIFTFDNNIPAAENYKTVHVMSTNQHLRSNSDLFQRAVIAAVAYHQLMAATPFGKMLKNDDDRALLRELLMRHLQVSPMNFHSLDTVLGGNKEFAYCTGAYPFLSMLNHSCVPNTHHVSFGTKTAVYVQRPIKKGQEVLTNYGPHHCMAPAVSRQASLEFQYLFKCKCEACIGNYPLYEYLVRGEIPTILRGNETAMLKIMRKSVAEQNLIKCFQYMDKYDQHYPCFEISEMHNHLKLYFRIYADMRSFQFKFESKYLSLYGRYTSC